MFKKMSKAVKKHRKGKRNKAKFPLLSLPNELIGECFSHLADAQEDIQNLRLVSKRIRDISTAFLITSINVNFTTKSLADLEELAAHSVYSKSIAEVTINVSYYDKYVAKSLPRFAEHCTTDLGQQLEWMERAAGFGSDEDSGEQWKEIERVANMPEQWNEVALPTFDMSKATDGQKIVLEAHEEYIKLYEDQEATMKDGEHIRRLITAFQQFPVLKKICIDDESREHVPKKVEEEDDPLGARLSRESLKIRCLDTSQWKGSFETAMHTEPPTHVIRDLFVALATSPIRLREFDMTVTTPANLRCLAMSDEQLNAVKEALSHTVNVEVCFQRWARKESLAEDNDRPRDEMDALYRFTSACFSSSHLNGLHLSLDDYPVFGEIPTISLSDLIPQPQPSSSITEIAFHHVPIKLAELETFVNQLKPTLTSLDTYGLYLLDGSWVRALDVLRELENLEVAEIQYPSGMEFGDQQTYISNTPEQEELDDYIMRESDTNPLIGWVPEED